jgi:hypothetical protein
MSGKNSKGRLKFSSMEEKSYFCNKKFEYGRKNYGISISKQYHMLPKPESIPQSPIVSCFLFILNLSTPAAQVLNTFRCYRKI